MGRLFDQPSHGRIRRRVNHEDWSFGTVSPRDRTLPETTTLTRRSLRFLEVAAAVIVLGLLVRTWVVARELPRLQEQALNNHLRTSVTRALRGVFYDADRTVLVTNEDRDSLALIPADVPRDPVARAALQADLVRIADIDPQEFDRVMSTYAYTYTPVPIASRLTPDQKVQLLVRYPDNANGITLEEDFSRRYTTSTSMSHILGYVSRITAEEYRRLKDSYRPQDMIGKSGLESSLETVLRGEDGERRISVNAQGQKVSTLATSPAVPGCDVVLNLRVQTQEAVQSVLARHLRAGGFKSGAVIVLDPRSGAVRALVSLPTYDNNIFSDGIRGEQKTEAYEKLVNDPNRPFLDRTVGGVYPPGSTFKIVTAAMALETKAVTPDERIESPGTITVAAELDPSLTYIYKDWKATGHGAITIIDAIAESSDTFFYQVIGGYEGRRGTGPDPLAETAKRFGFGSPLGIELAGEVGGTVPNPEWKNRTFTVDRKWFQGDTYNYSIGQGYLLSTPLQLASATAVVANGGTLYRPQLVQSYEGCSQARTILPYTIRAGVVDPSALALVRQGMRRSVTSDDGTAKSLRSTPVPIAGKTGTAQYANNTREHAWFTMFAPYDRPELVITVLVEGGGEGSLTAIPVARDVLNLFYGEDDA